jgi:hypothetical protein
MTEHCQPHFLASSACSCWLRCAACSEPDPHAACMASPLGEVAVSARPGESLLLLSVAVVVSAARSRLDPGRALPAGQTTRQGHHQWQSLHGCRYRRVVCGCPSCSLNGLAAHRRCGRREGIHSLRHRQGCRRWQLHQSHRLAGDVCSKKPHANHSLLQTWGHLLCHHPRIRHCQPPPSPELPERRTARPVRIGRISRFPVV